MPKRQVFELEPGCEKHNAFAVLPAWNQDVIGVKSFTYFPQNSDEGFDSLYSKIMLFSREHGVPLALVDGTSVTFWRTAAVSALASRYLSRENSTDMVFFGTGNLSIYMISAHLSVRQLKKVAIVGRNKDKVASLISQLKSRHTGVEFSVCEKNDIEAAVRQADIISCATGSPLPLVKGDWLKAGAHLDLIGNHNHDRRECDTQAILNSSVFVDSRTNVLNEAGELLIPISEGVFKKSDVKAELAQLCAKEVVGRQSDTEITLFKSVGTALSDLVAAHLVYKNLDLN
jgi:1-pyrroline-2-carboxylate reductase [NAD(P)H]